MYTFSTFKPNQSTVVGSKRMEGVFVFIKRNLIGLGQRLADNPEDGSQIF